MGRTRLPVCPKCRSKHLLLAEKTECWTTFEIGPDQQVDWEDGSLHPGETAGVWGECMNGACRHKWRLKGVVNVLVFEEITD